MKQVLYQPVVDLVNFVTCLASHLAGYFIGNKTTQILCMSPKLFSLQDLSVTLVGVTALANLHVDLVKGVCAKGHVFDWCSSDIVLNAKGSQIFLDNLVEYFTAPNFLDNIPCNTNICTSVQGLTIIMEYNR